MKSNGAWVLKDLIEKNKRVFKIPVYQRNYDWTNVQCEKLFEDIIIAFKEDRKHFTGSIVYINDISSSILDEDLIIDGQQRITTIFILLKVLYDIANNIGETKVVSDISDYLYNRNCDEKYKLKLKPVKTDQEQFYNLMVGNDIGLDENSNIVTNYKILKKLVLAHLDENFSLSDILRGMKNLEIVEIVLDRSQGDDPQTIFESINSTGLELSLADLIRNYLLMSDTNQDVLYERYWSYMESVVGNENLANFFVQYLNFKINDSVTEKNAYNKFKKYSKSFTHEEVLKDMKRCVGDYAAFIGRANAYNAKINSYLRDFRLLDQSTVYVFLFSLFREYDDGNIDTTTLEKVLCFLRSYFVRRIVCGIPSNSLRGLFKTLHARLFKNNMPKDYYGSMYKFFIELRTKDRMLSDDEFKHELVYGDLYKKTKCCKFILAAIENAGSNEVLDTSKMTIEHILPQRENSVVWQKEIGEGYSDVYNKYLHTLGNLTITGYNSELGTKSFSEKKDIIREHSKANILNKEILSAARWNEDSILLRADTLSGHVLRLLDYDKLSDIGMPDNSDDNKKYRLSDMSLVANTKPVNYTFYGETVSVKSYSNMLFLFIKTLYDLDDKKIRDIAKRKFSPTSTNSIYISLSEKDIRKPKEIGNTGIFYETNLSATSVLKFISGLIEVYNLSSEEFEFTVV
ncbi:MAG: DUF262 domain-containing protein [Anaerovibrio sp.]